MNVFFRAIIIASTLIAVAAAQPVESPIVVDSIAAMKALNRGNLANRIIRVKGQQEDFIYDPASSATAKEGVVFAPDTLPGRFLRQVGDIPIRVAWWDISTSDDTAAIQAAVDVAVANGGGEVLLPAGTLVITDTILLKASNVRIKGEGFSATKVQFSNVAGGIAFSGDSDKTASLVTYSYCALLDFSISSVSATNDADICVDLTSFAYSYFRLHVQTKRTNASCYYGQGNNGSSPYYNRIEGYLFGGTASGTNYTQTGIKFAQGAWAGGSNGANANVVGPIPRAAALQFLLDCQSGNGNLITGVSGESINDAYFRFNFNAAVETGTSAGGNGQATLVQSGPSWLVNAYVNDTVKITAGTGAGQVRTIASNSTSTLTLVDPWAVVPDATSTFAIYEGLASGNKIMQCRAEGLASLNPDFIDAQPGTTHCTVSQSHVQSLGSGLYVRDDSGTTNNRWFSGATVVFTESLIDPGPSANIDLYPKNSVFGGVRLPGKYSVEWLKVAATSTSLNDTATAQLDVGGTAPGNGDMTLTVVVPTGSSQGMAMPTSSQKVLRDGTNRGLFLNVQTGASFSATVDLQVTWAVTLE